MNAAMNPATANASAAAVAAPYLAINNVEVIYNHVILVLKGVSLQVPQGGIVALLGANGAGKSTTLKSISNLLHAERGDVTKGSIEFKGARVDRMTPNELVKRGVIQVMEGRHCFGHLSIEENLLTGAYTRSISRGELADNLGVDVSFVYNRAWDQIMTIDRNAGIPGTANVFGQGAQGRNPAIFSDTFTTNLGFIRYKGLLVDVRKRLSRGMQGGIAYSLSKTEDNAFSFGIASMARA